MTVNSYRLPAILYKYLSLNEGRNVPFEELCMFVSLSISDAEMENKSCKSRVMEILIFLSGIDLITLYPDTAESCLNVVCRN